MTLDQRIQRVSVYIVLAGVCFVLWVVGRAEILLLATGFVCGIGMARWLEDAPDKQA